MKRELAQMTSPVSHVIEIDYLDEDRPYWQCDCGLSGSAPSDLVEIAAERHIKDGEPVSYRYTG